MENSIIIFAMVAFGAAGVIGLVHSIRRDQAIAKQQLESVQRYRNRPSADRRSHLLVKAAWHREQMLAIYSELCQYDGVHPGVESKAGHANYIKVYVGQEGKRK